MFANYLINKLVVGKIPKLRRKPSNTSDINVTFEIYFCRHPQKGMNILTIKPRGPKQESFDLFESGSW